MFETNYDTIFHEFSFMGERYFPSLSHNPLQNNFYEALFQKLSSIRDARRGLPFSDWTLA